MGGAPCVEIDNGGSLGRCDKEQVAVVTTVAGVAGNGGGGGGGGIGCLATGGPGLSSAGLITILVMAGELASSSELEEFILYRTEERRSSSMCSCMECWWGVPGDVGSSSRKFASLVSVKTVEPVLSRQERCLLLKDFLRIVLLSLSLLHSPELRDKLS